MANSKTDDTNVNTEVDVETPTSTPNGDIVENELTPMEKLKAKHKFFVIQNKSSTPKHLELLDDSVQINPNRTARIDSSKILQFPSKSWATILIPTIADMQEVGMIQVNNAVTG